MIESKDILTAEIYTQMLDSNLVKKRSLECVAKLDILQTYVCSILDILALSTLVLGIVHIRFWEICLCIGAKI